MIRKENMVGRNTGSHVCWKVQPKAYAITFVLLLQEK
jgi:hypothetical protein